MNKITGDITAMAAQVPALFETLSGMPANLPRVAFPFWEKHVSLSHLLSGFCP
jgi:hypothetical protein